MDTSNVQSQSTESVWVVGYDGSENSRHAALWAATHAGGRVDELRLVTAWHVPADVYLPAPGPYLANLPDDLEAGALQHVTELADAIRPMAKVEITATTAFGGAARCLIDSAPPGGAIVVGSRGRGGFARLLLGSTSTQVATHATSPTIVVPMEAPIDRADRLLVAVDGSANSLAAFDWAVNFAQPGSRIETVFVRDLSRLAAQAERFDPPSEPTDSEFELRRMLERRAADSARAVDVHHRTLEGSVRHELRRQAADADLLVLGARGHGAIGAALLGSVSTWLLHHLCRPMAVVPAPVERDDTAAQDERT